MAKFGVPDGRLSLCLSGQHSSKPFAQEQPMATIQLEHSRHQSVMQHPTWEQFPWTPSFVQSLGQLVQQGIGLAMLLFGSAMLFTLWLIPLGLPLTLLG